MKYLYPAIFTPEDGNMLVSVPDLPGLHTFGKDLADAIYTAQDAVEMRLWDAENKSEPIPGHRVRLMWSGFVRVTSRLSVLLLPIRMNIGGRRKHGR